MSENTENEWVWQGFFGVLANVTAAKLALTGDVRIGVMIPLDGPPMIVDPETHTTAMFAIQTRANFPVETPEGLLVASPSMVGRLVGG